MVTISLRFCVVVKFKKIDAMQNLRYKLRNTVREMYGKRFGSHGLEANGFIYLLSCVSI